MAKAKTLMIQGTASNVGKSIITAAFCRIFYRQGYKVAPFKAQNMSNNSFVTPDGGEIGRAQAVQAEACKIEPSVHMNPILLKPDTDKKAQVVALGKPITKIRSIGHAQYQNRFQPVVEDSMDYLRDQFDVVVIEGAGSPAEMNLKKRDLVNMSVASRMKSPVLLVGDIDWGGIFAQLVGTYELLDPSERKLVKAFLINKFRGDKKILDPGLDWIEKRTRKKVLGVIPFISDMEIAEEDSIGGDSSSMLSGLRANVCLDAVSGKSRDRRNVRAANDQLLVDVIWLPRISNFTDFDTLQKESDVVLRYLHEPDRHTLPDLVIIPGTKSTIADLKFLRKSGLADYILKCASLGVPVLGICGGYQMLGKRIQDADHMESKESVYPGLGLLPAETLYQKKKTTHQIRAFHSDSSTEIKGYEIHMGKTKPKKKTKPFFQITERDGASCKPSADGMIVPSRVGGKKAWIAGTYVHGLFDNSLFLRSFLNEVRSVAGLKRLSPNRSKKTVDVIDRLADLVEDNIDMDYLERIMH